MVQERGVVRPEHRRPSPWALRYAFTFKLLNAVVVRHVSVQHQQFSSGRLQISISTRLVLRFNKDRPSPRDGRIIHPFIHFIKS